MNKSSRKIDSYLMFLILEIFIIMSLFMLYEKENKEILNFIMMGITFFSVMVTYAGGMIIGLILSSIAIFIYASYIFYINLIRGDNIGLLSYLWIISIPIVAFTSGKLESSIYKLQEQSRILREDYENLVTIDEETGLGNIRSFYMDLEREISKSKRHKAPCTLMLIRLPYYKEIRKIIGKGKTKKLIKDISELIIISTRSEDERYTIENDTLAIIMANTDLKGAQVVKDRIKKGITDLNLKLREEKNAVNIDTKISIVEYEEKISNAIEFKSLAEEELQYDV